MRSSLKKIKDCRVRLEIEIEAERIEHCFSGIFKTIQKQARISGFREGRAPLDLVEKQFAKTAEEEVLKTLIPEAYHECVVTQKLSPVTLPSILDVRLERGKRLTFSAEFERAPEFSLKNYKGIKMKKVPSEVNPEDLEKGLAALLESQAELKPLAEPRPVQHGDFILTDVEIWKEGRYEPGKKGVILAVEPRGTDDFYDKVLGAQVNDVREVSLDGKPHYKLWVKGIHEKKLPVLDENLAKVFGKASVEELKDAVNKDSARFKQSESFAKMKAALFEKLLSMASFTVPEGLVQKQKEHLLEQARKERLRKGLPEIQFETLKPQLEGELMPRAKREVELYFILQKVAELERIDLDEEELERKLALLAEESKRSLEEVRSVFEQDLRESMIETKTIDFLLANAKWEEAA